MEIDEKNTFKMTLPIMRDRLRTEKSVDASGNEVTKRYICGIASGTGLDHHGERMAESAIKAFAKAIEGGMIDPYGDHVPIPLRSGHRKEWDDVLGFISKAEIDDEHNLWIEAELDDTSSTAKDLYAKLSRTDGTAPKLGFSVGGKIVKVSSEWNADIGKSIRVIDEVALREISVVGQPAYAPAYVDILEKSFDWDAIEKDTRMENDNKSIGLTEVLPDEAFVANVVAQKAADEETNDAEKNVEEAPATPVAPTNEAPDTLTVLAQLADAVKALGEKVEAQSKPAEEVTPAPEEETTKNADALEDSDEEVAKALEIGFANFEKNVITKYIDPLSASINALTLLVTELASQPVDKSVTVRTQKEATEDTTLLGQFSKAIEKGTDPIDAAVTLGFNRKK